ncbi:MAG: signal peptidase II [Acidobacteria bacterium]|jgi:signal peptidase II|nr:signal peptidase II [Acidobacteriota bacterium]
MHLKNKKPYLLLMLAIILADQVSKWQVTELLPLERTKDVIRGFFRLWHVRNSGAVWGFFSGHDNALIPRIITVLAIVALLVVLYFFLRAGREARLELFAYTFILGGALGNVIDRLRLGYVVDFLDVYVKSWHWPTFNVADSCISVGVLLLAASLWRGSCTPS